MLPWGGGGVGETDTWMLPRQYLVNIGRVCKSSVVVNSTETPQQESRYTNWQLLNG